MSEILKMEANVIAHQVRAKKISAREVTQAFLTQAQKHNPQLGAFIAFNDQALGQADRVDENIQKGQTVGALAGVPVAVKDLICTKSLTTTAGSKILKNFVPPYSATLVEKLESAGAIILGKANLDEFAMGSSNETSAYGVCKNPWRVDCVPGGSSGGSAAAVAAAMSPLAIGTDTGGSIRQPASFCGVVGLKPTYGRVSRYGIIAFASSLDQAGPMSRSVKDAALALEVIGGSDPRDSTCAQRELPIYSEQINSSIKGVTIGIPKQFIAQGLDPQIEKIVEATRQRLEQAGAQFIEVDLPLTDVAVSTYYIIATSEASSNLSRYDGVKFGHRADFSERPAENLEEFYSRTRGEGFGDEVKRRVILGTYALSSGYYDAYYKKAAQVRRLIQQEFLQAFSGCQAILGPVTATPPFKIGDRVSDPLAMYLNDIYTTSANLAGIPGMSVPAGMTVDGLPVGVQLLAPHFAEQTLFNIGTVIEREMGMKERFPDVVK